ncbi:hypothetical protein BDQ17DRAFT_1539764 [Cyathus striatus]|nr:hypothetical protein BDQ17DRAFT_1539764 [Cyathus striatus]
MKHLEILRSLIVSKASCCYNTYTLPIGRGLNKLNYESPDGKTHGKLNLVDASVDDIRKLAEASSPATFGRGGHCGDDGLVKLGEDVLDLEYRNALKLDKEDFTTNFELKQDEAKMDILKFIRSKVLNPEWGGDKVIRAEMYKINIYGKDGFFKEHKDTPHSPNMFATLILKDAEKGTIACIAFYSDVTHEVKPVIAGNRLTITYSLYLEDKDVDSGTSGNNSESENYMEVDTGDEELEGVSAKNLESDAKEGKENRKIDGQDNDSNDSDDDNYVDDEDVEDIDYDDDEVVEDVRGEYNEDVIQDYIQRYDNSVVKERYVTSKDEKAFEDALKAALDDPKFMPKGGALGFGLSYEYPIRGLESSLLDFTLKGSDAMIMRVCKRLDLSPTLSSVYDSWEDRDWKYNNGKADQIITNQVRSLDGMQIEWSDDPVKILKGKAVLEIDDEEEPEPPSKRLNCNAVRILWVRNVRRYSHFKRSYIHYGNEASLNYLYGYIALTVNVDSAQNRLAGKEQNVS